MDRSRKHKVKSAVIVAIACVALVVIAAVTIIVKKYAPSNTMMSGYKYFEVDKDSDKTLVIIDGTRYEDTGKYVNEYLYLPADFVADKINVRFYEDSESNAILYTDDTKTFAFESGKNEYKDLDGNSYSNEYPVVTDVEGSKYIAWEFVKEYTNCTYAYGSEPERLSINSIEEKNVVTALSDICVRYRGGIKSDILEKVKKGSELYFEENLEDWIKVTTKTGYTGYVKSKDVSEAFIKIEEDTYNENYTRVMYSNGKVKLGWFQVSGTAGNSQAASLLSTASVNVISPTWYSISSASGQMTSYASASWVSDMHNKGISVWPLVNDFDKNIDYKALFSSKQARKNVIDTLIKDASAYGYDGINIDFENVKSDYAKDFLQFIRELAVACHKNNIILSTDNYKPEAYNKCYNLKEQSSYVDYVIIMAYDEHYAGSDAGSVASLPFVKEAVSDTLENVPAEQLIIGIPFYTRIWSVSGSSVTSKAVGMQAALDELNQDGQTAPWNEDAGQYVCSYEKNGVTKKIWFEEDKSIEEKLKVITENEAAGIAVWKLGLEKASVWSVINKYVK